MVQFGYLASTVVMGALLVLVFLFTEGKERTTAPPASGERESRIVGVAKSPSAWILGFLVLGVLATAATAAYVGAYDLSTASAGLVIGVLFAVLLAGFALVGSYTSARANGFQHSQAAAIGVWAVGLLLLVAIVVRLVTTG